MRDFWVASGHHLLDRDEAGRLLVTDAFLKAYLARPELLPPAEACEAERRLHHELLMHHPRRPVAAEEIGGLADPEARENWEVMLAFRDRLLGAPSLEAAYLTAVREKAQIPSMFMNQLVQAILRNALDGCDDPFVLRAAELLFRPQRVSVHEGNLLLADLETIEAHERNRHASPLLAMLGGPAVTALDILDAGNRDGYFGRSDAFDTVLNFSSSAGRDGLAAALAAWIAHLLGVRVTITPVSTIQDSDWAWFVGLDSESTRIGNALWNGEGIDPEAMERVIGLFRLSFADEREVLPSVGSRPIWLLLSSNAERVVHLKPQNLVAGLPLRAASS